MNIKNRIKVSISNIPKAKRSLSRILLLHPNTINRVLNKPQDYEY